MFDKNSVSIRRMSAAIQLTGWPKPEDRPCAMTKSPSAAMTPGLILESRWETFDQVEQPFAARCDVSAVLNVAGRPVSLGLGVIPPVEQGIERLENQGFVFRFLCVSHIYLGVSVPARIGFLSMRRASSLHARLRRALRF